MTAGKVSEARTPSDGRDTSSSEDRFSDGMASMQTIIHILQHLSQAHEPVPNHMVEWLADRLEEERRDVGNAADDATWPEVKAD